MQSIFLQSDFAAFNVGLCLTLTEYHGMLIRDRIESTTGPGRQALIPTGKIVWLSDRLLILPDLMAFSTASKFPTQLAKFHKSSADVSAVLNTPPRVVTELKSRNLVLLKLLSMGKSWKPGILNCKRFNVKKGEK